MRLLIALACVMATFAGPACSVAKDDLIDRHGDAGAPSPCPCQAGQVCVVPTCCTVCVERIASTGSVDGGVCPAGSIEGGYCSNQRGPCSIPCHAASPFCVDAPSGCSGVKANVYCSGNGQEGGGCYADGLHCIECY